MVLKAKNDKCLVYNKNDYYTSFSVSYLFFMSCFHFLLVVGHNWILRVYYNNIIVNHKRIMDPKSIFFVNIV